MLGILCGLPYLHCILCLQYVNVYVQSNVAALLVLEYRVTSYVDEVEAPPPYSRRYNTILVSSSVLTNEYAENKRTLLVQQLYKYKIA